MKLRFHLFLSVWCFLLIGCGTSDNESVDAGTFQPKPGTGFSVMEETVEDPNGPKKYRLAEFNDKVWLMENALAIVKGSWCYNEQGSFCGQYGRLYSASGARFACRSLGPGWRLPTVEEWKKVLLAYGGYIDDAKKTKGPSPQAALKNLLSPSGGVSLTLAGVRSVEGQFVGVNNQAFLWTSTEAEPYKSYFAVVYDKEGRGARISKLPKEAGGLCRCVRD